MPPGLIRAERRRKIRVRDVATHCRSHVKRAHRKNVHAVARYRSSRRGYAFHNARVNVRTFARRNMNSHARSAEQKRSFVFALGNHRSYAKSHSVEHKVGVVRIAVLLNAHIENLPAFLFEVRNNRFLQREAREIRAYYQVFVFNSLHFSFTPYLF